MGETKSNNLFRMTYDGLLQIYHDSINSNKNNFRQRKNLGTIRKKNLASQFRDFKVPAKFLNKIVVTFLEINLSFRKRIQNN